MNRPFQHSGIRKPRSLASDLSVGWCSGTHLDQSIQVQRGGGVCCSECQLNLMLAATGDVGPCSCILDHRQMLESSPRYHHSTRAGEDQVLHQKMSRINRTEKIYTHEKCSV